MKHLILSTALLLMFSIHLTKSAEPTIQVDLQNKVIEFLNFLRPSPNEDQIGTPIMFWQPDTPPTMLGTLTFNRPVIEYIQVAEGLNGYLPSVLFNFSHDKIQFFIQNNQIFTNHKHVYVLNNPKEKTLITYTDIENSVKDIHINTLSWELTFNKKPHHIFIMINVLGNAENETQETLLTHLLKKNITQEEETNNETFNNLTFLLQFPKLLVHKTNSTNEMPLALACEMYNYWLQQDNTENIETSRTILQKLLNHPLFAPEVLDSQDRTVYELLEHYGLYDFLENLDY